MPGRRRPARGSPGLRRQLRRSRPDSLHREEQHGEAEQMEPAAGFGVAGVVGGRDNGGGGRSGARSGARSAIRVRVCRGGAGERERGSRAPGYSTYPPWGGGGIEGAAEGRHGDGSGSEATIVHREDGTFAKKNLV